MGEGLVVREFLGELGARAVLVATAAALTTGTGPGFLVAAVLGETGQLVLLGHLLTAIALLMSETLALGLGLVPLALLLSESVGDHSLELDDREAVFARETFLQLFTRAAGEAAHCDLEGRDDVDHLAVRQGGLRLLDDDVQARVERELCLEHFVGESALTERRPVVLLDFAVLQLLAELEPSAPLRFDLRVPCGTFADGLETFQQRAGVPRELGAAGVLQQDRLGQQLLGLHALEVADLREGGNVEQSRRSLLEAGLAGVELLLRRLDLDLGLGRNLDDDGLGDNLGHSDLDDLATLAGRASLLGLGGGDDDGLGDDGFGGGDGVLSIHLGSKCSILSSFVTLGHLLLHRIKAAGIHMDPISF